MGALEYSAYPYELIRSFLEQANAQGSRSTALSPLGWLTAIISSALFTALLAKAPSWAIVTILTALGLCVLMYFAAYIFFMIKSPDALRSEKFTLSKLAIERSVIGDNLSGLIDPENPKQLPPPSVTNKQEVT